MRIYLALVGFSCFVLIVSSYFFTRISWELRENTATLKAQLEAQQSQINQGERKLEQGERKLEQEERKLEQQERKLEQQERRLVQQQHRLDNFGSKLRKEKATTRMMMRGMFEGAIKGWKKQVVQLEVDGRVGSAVLAETVNHKMFLTCLHAFRNLTGNSSIIVRFYDKTELNIDGNWIRFYQRKGNILFDIAIIMLPPNLVQSRGVCMSPIFAVGEVVATFSWPHSRLIEAAPVLSVGMLGQAEADPADQSDHPRDSKFVTDTVTSGGSSGGGVFGPDYCLIGIVSNANLGYTAFEPLWRFDRLVAVTVEEHLYD